MTHTELINLIPGECVITIYGDTGMVMKVLLDSVELNIINSNDCCQYFRDYEIKCRLNEPKEIDNGFF